MTSRSPRRRIAPVGWKCGSCWNGAEFEQAFPKLRLRFTNAAGERIIDHTFLPPDYLAPEDRLFQALPSRLPVQVLLDVPDPGPAAVNYALELH